MLTCKKANRIDLVNYLEKLGYQPAKARGNDYWYLSPLRQEKTASFKVNRKLNAWFDHGIGKGGGLVSFGTQYFNCTVSELLARLSDENFTFSFSRQQESERKTYQDHRESKIKILDKKEIVSIHLVKYLKKRGIDPEIARVYCCEARFEMYGKKYRAIGFENNGDGLELRSEHFKGSSAPKGVRVIDKNDGTHKEQSLRVFEGFFDFLSWMAIEKSRAYPIDGAKKCNFLILNSIAFLDKSKVLMDHYDPVYLLFDRDKAGRAATERALSWGNKYQDESGLYDGFKDLNEYWVDKNKTRT